MHKERKREKYSFEVANIFNYYFIKVGSNLAEQIISDINPLHIYEYLKAT